jgi:hypothetical protein
LSKESEKNAFGKVPWATKTTTKMLVILQSFVRYLYKKNVMGYAGAA